MNLRQNLESRWRWNDDRYALVKSVMLKSLDVADAVAIARTKAEQDPNLTDIGRVNAIRSSVGDMAAEIFRGDAAAQRMRKALDTVQLALRPVPPDKTDAIAAVQHSEIRAALRAIGGGKGIGLAIENPAFAEAVLAAPKELSGFDQDQYDRLLAATIERNHAGAVKKIEDATEAVDHLATAVNVAKQAATAAGGFRDTNELTAFITQSVGARANLIAASVEQHFGGFDPLAGA